LKCARLRACDPGLVGDVSECAIAVVVIQNIASILGHEKIVKSVVVVIAPDTAHAITGSGHAGFLGDIGKSGISVVAIESIADGNAAAIKVATVDKINVLPAVAIEISNTDAGAEFLAIDRNGLIPLKWTNLMPEAAVTSVNWIEAGWEVCA